MQCHGAASPMAHELQYIVRQHASFCLIFSTMHQMAMQRDWNMLTAQEEAPPEGRFSRSSPCLVAEGHPL